MLQRQVGLNTKRLVGQHRALAGRAARGLGARVLLFGLPTFLAGVGLEFGLGFVFCVNHGAL